LLHAVHVANSVLDGQKENLREGIGKTVGVLFSGNLLNGGCAVFDFAGNVIPLPPSKGDFSDNVYLLGILFMLSVPL
jgi:hypothetical protein